VARARRELEEAMQELLEEESTAASIGSSVGSLFAHETDSARESGDGQAAIANPIQVQLRLRVGEDGFVGVQITVTDDAIL